MLNTGTIAGVSCNIFDGSLPPKYLPSFSWGSAAGLTDYRLDKALQTAERVMARRKKVLSQAEQALLRHIFHATAGERAVPLVNVEVEELVGRIIELRYDGAGNFGSPRQV